MSNDTEHDYWQNVHASADEAADNIKGGQDCGDALHEAEEGSYWVIYYHAAAKMLLWSPNDSAIFDECGAQEFDGYGDAVTKMAAWAYSADVRDYYFRTYNEDGTRLNEEDAA